VYSDWDVVAHQRDQELSTLEVNSGVLIFRVKHGAHYEEMFGIVCRYLVSMVDTCRPRTLSTRDINIKVPSELH